MNLSERFYLDADFRPGSIALYWKSTGALATTAEVTELYRGAYIYRSVYEATVAENERINAEYDSR